MGIDYSIRVPKSEPKDQSDNMYVITAKTYFYERSLVQTVEGELTHKAEECLKFHSRRAAEAAKEQLKKEQPYYEFTVVKLRDALER